jgi:hypothetical protein
MIEAGIYGAFVYINPVQLAKDVRFRASRDSHGSLVNALPFGIYRKVRIVAEQQKDPRLSNDSWIALLAADNHNTEV